MEGKKRLLIILGCIWVFIIAYNVWTLGFSRPGTAQRSAPVARGAAPQEKIPLRPDLLERPRPPYRGVARDIFSPFRAREEKPKVSTVEVSPPPAPPPAPPPSALSMFASQARFLGFVEKAAGKRTVFISRGPDVFLARKNDLLNGKFRVKEITGEQLILIDESSGEEAGIALLK